MNAFIEQLTGYLSLPLKDPILIFALILTIILFSPSLNRIRIPSIIGLIFAGMAIGPHGFQVIEKDMFVDVFSTIGLLYIMFLAGLELNLNEFKANKNKSILFGIYTFALPLAVGFPVCYYLLGFDVYASLLVSSIFATHTLISYPTVSRFGITKDRSVAITVGGTILTDAAVLIVLAIILGAKNDGLTQQFWVQLIISISIFSCFMFFVIPKIADWFLNKFAGEVYSHYIFVLSIVFLAAFLSKLANLEPIIGAFMAGLALNRAIPISSALMNRIDFLGNSLFIPFFLISVGMIVDISVITSGTATIITATVLTLVAMFGKYIAAIATRFTFKMSRDQGNLIFGLSSAHAAATLAVIMVGHEAGIADDMLLNAIIVIILVSCVASSFITEKAAANIAEEYEEENDPTLLSELDMEQILIPLSSTSNVASLLGFSLLIKDPASTHPLALLNVVDNNEEAEKQVALAKKQMESYLSEITATDTEVNVIATIEQNKSSGIARTAREIAASLIVIGWPKTEGLFEHLTKDQHEGILHNTNRTLFICHLPNPLVTHKAVFIIIPPHAEYEEGFEVWLDKLLKLSSELTVPLNLNCTRYTYEAINEYCKTKKLKSTINFNEFEDWDDILILFRNLADTDLIVFVSSRKKHLVYNAFTGSLPQKLERYFNDHNRIVVYPQ